MSGKTAASVKAELERMFVLGSDMPVSGWQDRLKADETFAGIARCLVWQAGGRRFMLEGGACVGKNGTTIVPMEPVSLAHPVEMDADEILCWRDRLSSMKLTQPFHQMWEPVVLKKGALGGRTFNVDSGGTVYEMNGRYDGYTLKTNVLPKLKAKGWRFVVRNRWDDKTWYNNEIEVVNMITPAGILYGCTPDKKIESLNARADANLRLKLFYAFGGVRLRTLNHTAVTLEGYLTDQFAAKGDLDLLLPHLPGLKKGRLADLYKLCPKESELTGVLEKLIRRENEPC